MIVRDQAVPFAALPKKAGKIFLHLADSRSCLANLPDNERSAKELLAWGAAHFGGRCDGERYPLDTVRLREPVEVAGLFDVTMTPRHLKNPAEVLMKYERDDPQIAPLLQAFAKAIMAPSPKPEAVATRPTLLPCYKSNMNSIVGDGETVPWPAYTSRLDLEPELAGGYAPKLVCDAVV